MIALSVFPDLAETLSWKEAKVLFDNMDENKSMAEEIMTIEQKGVWTNYYLPPFAKLIATRFLYQVKRN